MVFPLKHWFAILEREQPLRLRAHPMPPGQQALGEALVFPPIANSGRKLVEDRPLVPV